MVDLSNVQVGQYVKWDCPESGCLSTVTRRWGPADGKAWGTPHCSYHGYPWIEMKPTRILDGVEPISTSSDVS